MKIFSALLALCAGNSPVTGELPSQRPVARRFDAGDFRRHWRHCSDLVGYGCVNLQRHQWLVMSKTIGVLSLRMACKYKTLSFQWWFHQSENIRISELPESIGSYSDWQYLRIVNFCICLAVQDRRTDSLDMTERRQNWYHNNSRLFCLLFVLFFNALPEIMSLR